MPGLVPPIADERDGLLAYLAQQRDAFRIVAYGLSDEQARATPTASALSVGGLIKHVAFVESGWIHTVLGTRGAGGGASEGADFEDFAAAQDDYADNFVLGPDETVAEALEAYAKVAARTEATVAGIDDLGQAVPVPKGVPWYPDDVEAWSVRWVLLHLIQETARHAGHADIVRESIDGATMYPLMAAVEGWPTSPWMQPWEPANGRAA
jgi:uncharacterized damage-inducible protein DinB